jgi:hypothetical protein
VKREVFVRQRTYYTLRKRIHFSDTRLNLTRKKSELANARQPTSAQSNKPTRILPNSSLKDYMSHIGPAIFTHQPAGRVRASGYRPTRKYASDSVMILKPSTPAIACRQASPHPERVDVGVQDTRNSQDEQTDSYHRSSVLLRHIEAIGDLQHGNQGPRRAKVILR